MRKDHNYLCIEYCSVFFRIIKTHEESTSTIADDGHYRETELEEIHNCIRLYYDLCGRFRSDIAQSTDTGQQKCLTQPKSDRLDHAVNGGAKTICTDSVLFFHMIQNFSQISQGCDGVLSHWLSSGMKQEPQEIANFIMRASIHTVRGFQEE